MLKVKSYFFDGPFSTVAQLESKSGVYAILDCTLHGTSIVDIGESQNVKSRVSNHDRKSCWSKNCQGTTKVAVYYASEPERISIEKELRQFFNPPCGIF